MTIPLEIDLELELEENLDLEFEAVDAGCIQTRQLTVTPDNTAQTFRPPEGYVFGKVIVEAIPSNYGLITWNGAVLTVS